MPGPTIHYPDPVRKIPSELDSPVDNLLLVGVRTTVGFYRRLGFTPNGITTLSLITGLASGLLLYQRQYLASAALYLISYFYDCMDGYMARKYSLTSQIGDIYDHIKDYVTGVLVIALLWLDYRDTGPLQYALLALPLFMATASIHVGGQEVYYGKTHHNTLLSLFRKVSLVKTRDEAARQMRFSRYFSTGSLTVVFCALIAALKWIG